MKKSFIKLLPLMAAVMLATSCSKDDDNTVQTSDEQKPDITSNGIPFSIKAVATYSNTLSKIAYSDDTETQIVTMKFETSDVDNNIYMYVNSADNTHKATLWLTKVDDEGNGIFDGSWDEQGGEPDAGTTLTATVVYNYGHTINYSTTSLADLMSKCAHNYTATFTFGSATSVTLEDNMAYLEFILAPEQNQVYLNGAWRDINPDSHKYWYAAEGGTKVTTRLKGEKTLVAGNVYTISCKNYVDLGQNTEINNVSKILLWRTSNDGRWEKPSSERVDVNSTNDRCPTLQEFEQLDELDDEIGVDENNIKGIRFYNDHGSLFLQARGYYYDDGKSLLGTWEEENELGQYWIAPQEDGKKSFMKFRITTSKAKSLSLTKKNRMSMISYSVYTGAQGSVFDPKTYYTARLVKAL